MTNLKQCLLDGVENGISEKEEEIQASDIELETLSARLTIENNLRDNADISAELREDFKYSAMALDNMLIMEQERNKELKKDLEMIKYRKTAVEKAKQE